MEELGGGYLVSNQDFALVRESFRNFSPMAKSLLEFISASLLVPLGVVV